MKGFLLLLMLIATLSSAQVAAQDLKAGVARVDFTPPLSLQASLGGYGARMSKPATGVHDRVWAKAMVASDGSRRFALVTADVLAFPPGFKSAVVKALGNDGWKDEQIMLLPSHSHTSLDMMAIHPKNTLNIPQIGIFNRQLFDLTVANLAKVITEASRDLVSVRVGTHSVALHGWNRNRRKDNTACDSDLTITRIDTAAGKPLAVLVNWTAHPTFMDAEDMMFSGDWPGHLQRTVEALIGQNVSVLYFNGAEGDQSPTPRPDSGGPYEKADRYGRELGIIVWREWEKIKTAPAPTFSYRLESITLPKRTHHPDFMRTGGAEYGLNEQLIAGLLALLFPTETHSISLRLGDLLIIGVPGEMTAELGTSVKSRVRQAIGAKHVVIGGLADEWISYVLSAEEYKKGGYEASMSFYGETLGQVVVEGVVKGASRLK